MKLLVVIDMQNDFIDGSLGSDAAKAIVPKVCEKLRDYDYMCDHVTLFTADTHDNYYNNTLEGIKLPVSHCQQYTYGWAINKDVTDAYIETTKHNISLISKNTFGSFDLCRKITSNRGNNICDYDSIELLGLMSDICVISNALLLRAAFPDTPIIVDASCCAGTTPERHKAALEAMKSCQIDVINEE